MRLGDLDRLAEDIEMAVEDAPLHVQATVQQYIDCTPTLDPIRAVGRCRYGECKRYGTGPFGYGCYAMFDGRAAVIPHSLDYFCSDGVPREAKDDG